MTRGFARISAGVPSAITAPYSSTVMRSDTPMTTFMSCSMSRTVRRFSSRDATHERGELRRLLGVHSGGRLVEKQELRIRRQCARHLEAPLIAVRERPRVLLVAAWKPAVDEELASAITGLRLLALDPRRPQDRPDDAAPKATVHAHEHVLDRRHLGEEPDVLERPPDAELDDGVRRLAHHLGAVEHDRTGRGDVDTGDLVEERRLPGAVRADEGDDRASRNGEVDVVRRDEASELLPDLVRDEQVVHGGSHQSSVESRSVSAPSVWTS